MKAQKRFSKISRLIGSLSFTLTVLSAGIFIYYMETVYGLSSRRSFILLLLVVLLPSLGLGRIGYHSFLCLSDAFWPNCLILTGFMWVVKPDKPITGVNFGISYLTASVFIIRMAAGESADIRQLTCHCSMIAAGGFLMAVFLSIYALIREGLVPGILSAVICFVLYSIMVIIFHWQGEKWVKKDE